MNLKIRSLTKKYNTDVLFENLNIDIPQNKVTCFLGPSGCGKSTLLNILAGLEDYNSGDISDFSDKTFSSIFQEPRLLPWKTVEDNLKFVLKSTEINQEILKSVDKYLETVGLGNNKKYYPSELSGGMKQRVSIARAFIYPSDILIMDEPFNGLDIKIKNSIIKSFISLWTEDKRTVVYVTHDISEALKTADRIFVFPKHASDSFHVFDIDTPIEKRSRTTEEIVSLKNSLKEILLD